jgi:hypothetical protein
MPAAVVADGRADLLRNLVEIENQLQRRLFLQRGVTLQRLVQIGHVGLVMFTVVNPHRRSVDVRLQGFGAIGQFGQLMRHGWAP